VYATGIETVNEIEKGNENENEIDHVADQSLPLLILVQRREKTPESGNVHGMNIIPRLAGWLREETPKMRVIRLLNDPTLCIRYSF
jgi:hypothetical protein